MIKSNPNESITTISSTQEERDKILERKEIASILYEVSDPELPGISIVDLGMVVDIFPEEDHWHVLLATTYSGCPAIDVIPMIVRTAFEDAGVMDVKVSMGISPPWSTDWISEVGKEKL
ncbi:MAG: iron-sulfur cluster assembly protein, partial [Saprospiraceae bacterium]